MNKETPNNQAGKGDKPRNCFSQRFKENYNTINWKIENQMGYVARNRVKETGLDKPITVV